MFKALRDKLKGALSSFTRKTEETVKEEDAITEEPAQAVPEPVIEEPAEAVPEPVTEEPAPEPIAADEPIVEIEEPEEPVAEIVEEPVPEPTIKEVEAPQVAVEEPEVPMPRKEAPAPVPVTSRPKPIERRAEQPQPEQKGFFGRMTEKLTTVQLSDERFEELFWDLELALLENNVAVEVIEKIKADLRDELTTGRTARGGIEERVQRRLEESITEVLDQEPIDLLASCEEHKPLIIAAVGVNGSGKTTTLAKLARYFQNNGKTVVLAAGDTFRAAAIQQLEEHAKRLNVPIIKQAYGADPAAVAFDAIKHAQSKGTDVVLIDTAGRLHSNTNLMDELKKVIRVSKPHHVLFVGEAITGNDCVEQAQAFGAALPIDGIILTKADVDEKGGAALSVSYVTGLPIVLIGTGQEYDDLEPFDPASITRTLLS